MNTNDLNTIYDRITKLQALANDASASESEVQQATMHIQRLLDRYNISLASVKPVTKSDIGKHAMPAIGSRKFEWEINLIHTIATHFYCRIVFTPDSWTFIGTEIDANVAQQLFTQVRAILINLATQRTSEYSEEMYLKYGVSAKQLQGTFSLRSYRLSYLLGAVSGLGEKLKAQRIEAANDVQALVIVRDQQLNDALAGFYPKLKMHKASGTQLSDLGYKRGIVDGKNLSLNKELADND